MTRKISSLYRLSHTLSYAVFLMGLFSQTLLALLGGGRAHSLRQVSAYCKEYIDRLTFYVNEHAKTTESRATQLLNDMLPKQVRERCRNPAGVSWHWVDKTSSGSVAEMLSCSARAFICTGSRAMDILHAGHVRCISFTHVFASSCKQE